MMKIENLKTNWEYRTFVKFLKKEKLYYVMQKHKAFGVTYLASIISESITSPSEFSDLALNITRGRLREYGKDLVYSQLWRFFALEELENTENDTFDHALNAGSVKYSLIRALKENGYRHNERIIELFKKHEITPRFK